MDIRPEIGLSDTDKTDDHHESCKNTREALQPLFVDEQLIADVTKNLNIQDTIEHDSTSHKSCEFQKKDSCDEHPLSKTMIQASEKCLSKHATFPASGKTLSLQDDITSELSTHNDIMKPNDPSGFRSISLPGRLNPPVSAMKGSREKRGAVPPVKLTVKWAPDVYDPIPTSVSHLLTTNKSSSKHNKRNSKNKQKHGSKSSRGSKSKDKKQVRKRGGSSCSSSGTGYKMENEKQLVEFVEPEAQSGGGGGVEFHVGGNQERLCGSSFMKRCGERLHLSSVAEAT